MILDELGKMYGTDKVLSENGYTEHYAKVFDPIRHLPLKVLEIGVYNGASIRMWEAYFPRSKVYGVDNGRICSPKVMESLRNERVVTEYVDQSNRDDLINFLEKHGGEFDIIIDDGHHYQEHQQVSWGALFPALKSGGHYIIEDIVLPTKSMADKPYREGKDELDWSSRWGIKDAKYFSDATWTVLLEFVNSGNLVSPYMTDTEKEFIENTIQRNKHEVPDIRIHTKAVATIAFMRKK
mgnify:CR=1 FL=1|tara:strand:+ start:8087 stop:8800 length:714 start_codon:yes stop_codon:yes gene_type:complete